MKELHPAVEWVRDVGLPVVRVAMVMRLGELRRAMSATAATVEPRLLSLDDAKVALGDVTAMKNITALLEGRLAARVASASEWERSGFASPEAWLAAQTGTSPGKAKETLETARRLEDQPEVAEAAERGELSAEQAAAVADAAEANPAAAPALVAKAKALPLGKLRDECAKASGPLTWIRRRRMPGSRRPGLSGSAGLWTGRRDRSGSRLPSRWR